MPPNASTWRDPFCFSGGYDEHLTRDYHRKYSPSKVGKLLWHGNTFRADQVLSWPENDLDTEDPGETQRKLAKYLNEFTGYIQTNTA